MALYERNYPQASVQLKDSLAQREAKLTTDQTTMIEDKARVAEAACFLGQSLNQEGKYDESATAYRRCVELWPNNPIILNNAAVNLLAGPQFEAAGPLLDKAIVLSKQERDLGLYATVLTNSAELLKHQSKDEAAKALLFKALEIRINILGLEDPLIATTLNNLAQVFQMEHNYERAEKIYRHALQINEKVLPPNDQNLAGSLNNLGVLLAYEGQFAEARSLLERALAIDQTTLGPNHPHTQSIQRSLARLPKSNAQLPK